MISLARISNLVAAKVRAPDEVFERRVRADRYVLRFLRTCAVCKISFPPIDFLCPSCWRALGHFMNRAESIKQPDYVIPTLALLTWTPANASFVKPLIYAYKGGRAALASEKLATLFLSEMGTHARGEALLISAPATTFDHSLAWTHALAKQTRWPAEQPLQDKTSRDERQKQLQQGERGLRRFTMKEHFAYQDTGETPAKRIVFADDVVTSGSTAMAAYMALGDPERFEVWALVARPRLATKGGAC